jgi:hypothetical protein
MSLTTRLAVVTVACMSVGPAVAGCSSEEVTVAPALTVVEVSLGPLDATAPVTGASRREPVVVRFSRPVTAPSVAAGVVVVDGEADEAFLADLDHPPLTASRQARLVPGAALLGADGASATWCAAAPLRQGGRYTLLVGAAVRAAADGRPLAKPLAYGFVTEAAAAGAPTLALVAPVDGGSAPPNLRRIWLALSAPVTVPPGALALEGPDAPPLAAGAPTTCGRALCLPLELAGRLQPGGRYTLAIGPGVVDDAGREAAAPEHEPSFQVERVDDRSAPGIGQVAPLASDHCLVVRWVTTEPADSRLTVTLGPVSLTVVDPAPVTLHEIGVSLPPGGGLASFTAASADLAGLGVEAGASLPVADLPRVAITEILPNPRGPEPAQEWVELRNLGAAAVDTDGLVLASARGGRSLLPDARLAPGGYALVVSAGYDPYQGEDPPPAPGALLLRVAETRVAGGLTNAGEALTLADASGALLSRYGGYVDASAKSAEGHSVVRVDETACDVRASFALSAGDPTPGAGP